MRRPTLIMMMVLFAIIVGAAIVQLTQDTPTSPFPGPRSGTPLPPGLTTLPPSSPGS